LQFGSYFATIMYSGEAEEPTCAFSLSLFETLYTHMEQMLASAGALLIEALPTFIVVVILHWYLKTTLFQPLEKVLAERYAQTKGAREQASAAIAAAEEKVAEYDAKLKAARAQIYQEQESWRKQLLDAQNQSLLQSREEAKAQIQQAKADLGSQLEQSRQVLAREAEGLADQIVAGILKGSKN
jgi:F-type H+-transporting ATPase subunit b